MTGSRPLATCPPAPAGGDRAGARLSRPAGGAGAGGCRPRSRWSISPGGRRNWPGWTGGPPTRRCALVGVTAWGGAGKTALVTHWVQGAGVCPAARLAGGVRVEFLRRPLRRALGRRRCWSGRGETSAIPVTGTGPAGGGGAGAAAGGAAAAGAGRAGGGAGRPGRRRVRAATGRHAARGADWCLPAPPWRPDRADQPVPVRRPGNLRRRYCPDAGSAAVHPRRRCGAAGCRRRWTGCRTRAARPGGRPWTGTPWRSRCWPGCWPTGRLPPIWPRCARELAAATRTDARVSGYCGSTRGGWMSRTGTCSPRCPCSPGRSRAAAVLTVAAARGVRRPAGRVDTGYGGGRGTGPAGRAGLLASRRRLSPPTPWSATPSGRWPWTRASRRRDHR